MYPSKFLGFWRWGVKKIASTFSATPFWLIVSVSSFQVICDVKESCEKTKIWIFVKVNSILIDKISTFCDQILLCVFYNYTCFKYSSAYDYYIHYT